MAAYPIWSKRLTRHTRTRLTGTTTKYVHVIRVVSTAVHAVSNGRQTTRFATVPCRNLQVVYAMTGIIVTFIVPAAHVVSVHVSNPVRLLSMNTALSVNTYMANAFLRHISIPPAAGLTICGKRATAPARKKVASVTGHVFVRQNVSTAANAAISWKPVYAMVGISIAIAISIPAFVPATHVAGTNVFAASSRMESDVTASRFPKTVARAI